MKFIVGLLLIHALALPAEENVVFRVHAEHTYSLTCHRFSTYGAYQVVIPSRVRGTGFLIAHGETPLVVTAAHVVLAGWPIDRLTAPDGTTYQVQPPKTCLSTATVRVRIGDLAEVPLALAVDYENDLAMLQLPAAAIERLHAEVIPLAQVPAIRQQQVRAWGFPHTTSPQISPELTVTEAAQPAAPNFFTLSSSLGSGSSGGPVLAGTQCLGVISRDDGIQTRVISVPALQTLVEGWARRSKPYADGMRMAELVAGK